jgi:hypothetical protein
MVHPASIWHKTGTAECLLSSESGRSAKGAELVFSVRSGIGGKVKKKGIYSGVEYLVYDGGTS